MILVYVLVPQTNWQCSIVSVLENENFVILIVIFLFSSKEDLDVSNPIDYCNE